MNQKIARRISEAEAIGASLALVKQAGWTIQKNAQTSLSPAFWNYLYLPEPELLLVPSIDASEGARFPVTRAVREARSDAIVVAVRKNRVGERQTFASLAIWSSTGAMWFGPFVPWLSERDEVWLVPDMDSRAPEPSFRLGGGRLATHSAPYRDQVSRRRGIAAARALVNEAIGG